MSEDLEANPEARPEIIAIQPLLEDPQHVAGIIRHAFRSPWR